MRHEDISGDIGPLYASLEEPKQPMYSFNQPAYIVWQAVYDALRDKGIDQQHALSILSSKHMRWALDGKMTDILENAAYQYASAHADEWRKEF